MMMKPSQNKHYTATDIQRYHSGKMSFEEMNQMEKAALEDPMLADAIDGFENKNNVDNDLAFLREKMNGYSSKKSATNIRKLYTSLSIAASVLVVFSVAYFLIKKTESNQSQLSANTNQTKQNVSPVLHESTSAEKLPTTDSSSSFVRSENSNNNKSLEIKTQDADGISGSFSAKEAKELANILKSDKQKANKAIINKIKVQPIDNAIASLTQTPITTTTASAAQKQIASVAESDELAKSDNAKLAFESKKESINISSDSLSSFAIAKNDDVKAIAVSKPKAAIPAAANISNYADMQMQEVVVNGYSNTRKKSVNESVQKITAKDLKDTQHNQKNDMTSFDEYVTNHKTTCLDNTGNEIHGTVSLTFNINKNGRPEKIKIEQSLFKACDEQAIKLLNEGPVWNGSKKKKAVIKITF